MRNLDFCLEETATDLTLGYLAEECIPTRENLHDLIEDYADSSFFSTGGMNYSPLHSPHRIVEPMGLIHNYTSASRQMYRQNHINDSCTVIVAAIESLSHTAQVAKAFMGITATPSSRHETTETFFLHTFISSSVSELQKPTPPYPYAFERLTHFKNEKIDWDGFGGRPASLEIYRNVKAFLIAAQQEQLIEPSLALGNDGSVAIIWKNDKSYIAVDCSGGNTYIYLALEGDEVVAEGESNCTTIPRELINLLDKHFKDENCKNLR
ncbi:MULTISPECIES: hypothetical protein [Pseudomonadaceae]|uniref:hypothetical protein n=1 Tax=Pseudomonas solani TaxID=2731552 RepID=UPI0011DCE67C